MYKLQCLLEAHGLDAFSVPGWIRVKRARRCKFYVPRRGFTRCHSDAVAVRISHRSSSFPCLCSNSSPYYNQRKVESERKVIGMQRHCIYNYNAYLVTMLKQRPPSLHARKRSVPPSHSHDVIAASSRGCTVFLLLFITHVRCQLHCFSRQHMCSHTEETRRGEEERRRSLFPPPSSKAC